MKEEFQDIELVKNEVNHQFEMIVEGSKAFIIYEEKGNTVTLIHTEVESALQGRGASTAVIEKTLAYIEDNHLKLIPLCPLVVAYLRRHPEWKRILQQGINL